MQRNREFSDSYKYIFIKIYHARNGVVVSDETTQQYLSDLDNMHKVVLEAKGESDLIKVSEKLKEAGVDHKLWIEQPENFPTCLAVKPYHKEVSLSSD